MARRPERRRCSRRCRRRGRARSYGCGRDAGQIADREGRRVDGRRRHHRRRQRCGRGGRRVGGRLFGRRRQRGGSGCGRRCCQTCREHADHGAEPDTRRRDEDDGTRGAWRRRRRELRGQRSRRRKAQRRRRDRRRGRHGWRHGGRSDRAHLRGDGEIRRRALVRHLEGDVDRHIRQVARARLFHEALQRESVVGPRVDHEQRGALLEDRARSEARELRGESSCRLRALARVASQAAIDDLRETVGHASEHGWLVEHGGDVHGGGRGPERRRPCEHGVEQDADAPDIGTGVDLTRDAMLRSTTREGGERAAVVRQQCQRARGAEPGQLHRRRPLRRPHEMNGARIDLTVNHAVRVRGLERLADRERDIDGVLVRERAHLLQHRCEQVAALCLAHHERMPVGGDTHLHHPLECRALERGGLARVGEEAKVCGLDGLIHREEDLHLDLEVRAGLHGREVRARAIGPQEREHAMTSGDRIAGAQRQTRQQPRAVGRPRGNREQHGGGKRA